MYPSVEDAPAWAIPARDQWQWRGQGRPPFAAEPGPDQFSVWDYPRPPCLVPETREVVIRWGEVEVARTRRAIRVLETSHPPSFYLPWDDIARRPSHADKRRAWRWELLENEMKAVLRAGATEQELQAAAERMLNLAA